MENKRLRTAAVMAFFSLSSQTVAQSVPASVTPPQYKAGQIWKYNAPSGAEGSTVVVLKVDSKGGRDNVIHIRVEKVPVPSCGGFHLTTTIEHLAVQEKALRQSTTELITDHAEIPDAYFDAYKEWEKARRKEIIKRPLREVALPPPVGPMICNWREAA